MTDVSQFTTVDGHVIKSDLSLQMEDGKLHPNFTVRFKIFGYNPCDWHTVTDFDPNMTTKELKAWYQKSYQEEVINFYRASTCLPMRFNETLRSYTDHKGIVIYVVHKNVPIKFTWINAFGGTHHTVMSVKTSMTILEIVASFQQGTCKEAVFYRICFGSKKQNRSRYSSFGSVKNIHLSSFYAKASTITIELNNKSLFNTKGLKILEIFC